MTNTANSSSTMGSNGTDHVNVPPQQRTQNAVDNTRKRIVEGKLVDTLPSGSSGATTVGPTDPIYRAIDGSLSSSSSNGVLTSIAVEAKIQAGIDSLTQELVEANAKGVSGQFWSKIQGILFNRANPVIGQANSTDKDLIALAVAVDNLPELGTGPTSQTSNTPTSSTANTTTNATNPSGTLTKNTSLKTDTVEIYSAPQVKNQTTIDALMAQLNGIRITDVTATPTTSGNNKFDVGFRKRNGSLTMVLKYPSLAKFLNNEQLEALNNLSQILENHKNSPINAVGEIYGFSSIRVHGVNPLKYIKAKLKKTTFRIGLGRRPKTVAKSLNRAIDFYTDLLSKVTPANGADMNTLQFKQQFLNQLLSVNNAYMTRGAEGYVSNMIDTPKPGATTPQDQTAPNTTNNGQRASNA